jgi:hypothetical protein
MKAIIWPSGENAGCVAESEKLVILIHALRDAEFVWFR